MAPARDRDARDSGELDVRPGGTYRYTMVAPDGSTYPTAGVYREVVEPELLSFHLGGPGQHLGGRALITVIFEDLGEQTRMTFQAGRLQR